MEYLRLHAILVCFVLFSTSSLNAQKRIIIYEVRGIVEKANITYRNQDGGISQANDATLPWYGYLEVPSGFKAEVTAQNTSSFGYIDVNIYFRKISAKEVKHLDEQAKHFMKVARDSVLDLNQDDDEKLIQSLKDLVSMYNSYMQSEVIKNEQPTKTSHGSGESAIASVSFRVPK